MKPEAQRAAADRMAPLVATLSRAFQDEPAFAFIVPDARQRTQALMRAFDVFVREDLVKGCAFATPNTEGVTLWRAPGKAHDSLWDTIRLLPAFTHALGAGVLRGERVARSIAHHLPKTPVWYLHFAGSDPTHRGKGFGAAAIRAGLSGADRDGIPAYLETADPDNIGFYQGLGFEHANQWDVPGGPHFWSMQRSPPQV